jgi:RimJ/RimL family protein N-acetyltransferase
MTATRPAGTVLIGRFVRLDPLADADIPLLWQALGTPAVFAGGYGGGPSGLPAEADYPGWMAAYYGGSNRLNYVARLVGGPDDGRVVGISTLGDLDEATESAHIGWTAWTPGVWGTAVNPEAKLLMLAHAFDHGFGRVKLQADAVNARSRAAIAKLGAQFEGIVRRERPRPDGSWRDTAVYSILVDEWPAVRAGLEARLADAGDDPVRIAP